jgi:hypothetical protein
LPPLCRLRWNLTFGCDGEFVCANMAFTLLALALTSLEMICAL